MDFFFLTDRCPRCEQFPTAKWQADPCRFSNGNCANARNRSTSKRSQLTSKIHWTKWKKLALSIGFSKQKLRCQGIKTEVGTQSDIHDEWYRTESDLGQRRVESDIVSYIRLNLLAISDIRHQHLLLSTSMSMSVVMLMQDEQEPEPEHWTWIWTWTLTYLKETILISACLIIMGWSNDEIELKTVFDFSRYLNKRPLVRQNFLRYQINMQNVGCRISQT
jgi:hypothetical protein